MQIRENPEDLMKGIEEEKEKKGGRRSKWAIVVLVVLIIALAGATGWMYWQYREAKIEVEKALSADEKETAEVNKIIDDLKSVAAVPDEQPTVATIVDVNVLKEQNPDFYKDAQNGYKLILYTDRAIIFDAVNKKVINMIPVKMNTENQESSENKVAPVVKNVSITILNGTSEEGLSSNLEKVIASKKVEATNFSISSKTKASKDNYAKSTVWDVSGGAKANEIKQLADLLGFEYKAGTPEGESVASSDMVIIIGKDYKSQ
jgi:flagellar basal body-associated protein FliL